MKSVWHDVCNEVMEMQGVGFEYLGRLTGNCWEGMSETLLSAGGVI